MGARLELLFRLFLRMTNFAMYVGIFKADNKFSPSPLEIVITLPTVDTVDKDFGSGVFLKGQALALLHRMIYKKT